MDVIDPNELRAVLQICFHELLFALSMASSEVFLEFSHSSTSRPCPGTDKPNLPRLKIPRVPPHPPCACDPFSFALILRNEVILIPGRVPCVLTTHVAVTLPEYLSQEPSFCGGQELGWG